MSLCICQDVRNNWPMGGWGKQEDEIMNTVFKVLVGLAVGAVGGYVAGRMTEDYSAPMKRKVNLGEPDETEGNADGSPDAETATA